MHKYLVSSRAMTPLSTTDNFTKFHELLRQGREEEELKHAFAYVADNVSKTPKGSVRPVRDAKEVKRLATSSLCLSGGSLANLDLPASAVVTLDAGKIAFLLQNYNTVSALIWRCGGHHRQLRCLGRV